MKNKNVKIILVLLSISGYLCAGQTEVEVALVTLNWPSPFGQPGYQMEVIPPTPALPWPSWIKKTSGPTPLVADWLSPSQQGAFFGLNAVQTQGYCSQALLQNSETAFYLRRPDLSKIGNDMSTLYSWSDLLTSARITSRLVLYSPNNFDMVSLQSKSLFNTSASIPSSLAAYTSSATYTENAVTFPVYVWNFGSVANGMNNMSAENIKNDTIIRAKGNPTSYIFPSYGAYYTNPASGQNYCYFNSNNFSQYISQYGTLLTGIAKTTYEDIARIMTELGQIGLKYQWLPSFSSNYTTLTANSFQSLAGFASGETAGSIFAGLFISNDSNTTTELGGAQGTIMGGLSTYAPNPESKNTIYLGSGAATYLPLFLSDPGQPYVPAGWNFATFNDVYLSEKSLMTDYSDQLSFINAVTVPGS